MKKLLIILLTMLTIFLTSCSESHKKNLFDVKIGSQTINLSMNKTELCKLYENHENDAGIVYFFLDNKEKDNNFNATFYSDGTIKTFYNMSETTPVIRFFRDIHFGMSKNELYNSLEIKSKKEDADLYLIKFTEKKIEKVDCFKQQNKRDMNQYMRTRESKGTYLELFIDDNTVGSVRIIHNI